MARLTTNQYTKSDSEHISVDLQILLTRRFPSCTHARALVPVAHASGLPWLAASPAGLRAWLVISSDGLQLDKASKMNEQEYPLGIPECGSDALRFGLLAYCGHGRDINLDVQRVAGYSKFCNKLWNATRFAFKYLQEDGVTAFKPGALPVSLSLGSTGYGGDVRADLPSLADAWILSRLSETVSLIDEQMKAYQIAAASETLYKFWYNELCDVYLEAIKPVMQLDGASMANAATKHATQTVLHACLHNGIRLLHPFMPFVTEELYHRLCMLTGEPRKSVMNASYPVPGGISALRSPPAEQAMDVVFKISGSIRSLRATYLKGALEKHAPQIYIVCRNAYAAGIISSQAETIGALARSSKSPPPAAIHVVPEGCSAPRGCATEVLDKDTEVNIFLKGVVDFSTEVVRLMKELTGITGRLDKLKVKMSAPDYAAKCPAATQVPPPHPSSRRAPLPRSAAASRVYVRLRLPVRNAFLELPAESSLWAHVESISWHQSEEDLL